MHNVTDMEDNFFKSLNYYFLDSYLISSQEQWKK